MTIKRAGAWAGRSALSNSTKQADKAKELGLTDVALFVTGLEHRHFKLLRSGGSIGRAIRIFQDRGLRVHLTTWIRPSEVFITEMVRCLVPMCMEKGIASLDLDAESAWARDNIRGHRYYADLLENEILSYDPEGKLPVGVNDYASLQACTRHLAERFDIIRPQAYSVSYVRYGDVGADGKRWTTPSSLHWPGRTQRYAMDEKLWGAFPAKKLQMGLAAYKQNIRGYSPERAMIKCWDTAEELGAEMVWWWSLGHMRGEVAKTVKTLTGRLPS